MGQFIVSESEKKQIRLLYEVNKPLPQASNFVKTLARYLNIEPSTIIGLDWSLYKNDNNIKDQLVNLFETSKKNVTNKIKNIKLNTSLFNILKQKLTLYVPNNVTTEQKSYFDELKKGLTTDQKTTTDQTTTTVKQNQLTSNAYSLDGFQKIERKPTLSRFQSLI